MWIKKIKIGSFDLPPPKGRENINMNVDCFNCCVANLKFCNSQNVRGKKVKAIRCTPSFDTWNLSGGSLIHGDATKVSSRHERSTQSWARDLLGRKKSPGFLRIKINQNISLAAPKSLTGTTRLEMLGRSRSKNDSLGATHKGRLCGQSNETSSQNSFMCSELCSYFHPQSPSLKISMSQAPAFTTSSAQTSSTFTESAPPTPDGFTCFPPALSCMRTVTVLKSSLAPGSPEPPRYTGWMD